MRVTLFQKSLCKFFFYLKISYLKFLSLSVTDGNVKYWLILCFGFLFELTYFIIGNAEKS